MNTITEQWALFESSVMPKDAPPIQRQEMRRAFYSGAEAMLRIQHAIASGTVSEDAGVAILQGLHEELHGFAWMVATGKA